MFILDHFISLAFQHENSVFTSKKDKIVKQISKDLDNLLLKPFLERQKVFIVQDACESLKLDFKKEPDVFLEDYPIAEACKNFNSYISSWKKNEEKFIEI
eukprot:GHVP01012960.1.p1 GENE.GHVP01012960.1~~GHVP01012960.1.p1  ORF type:complete len:100 (-),score=23.73 GHVP01012960.1:1075-1374(-)